MTRESYLSWIDEQITFHEREISKLMIAREVLAGIPEYKEKKIKPNYKMKSKPKTRRRSLKNGTFGKVFNVMVGGPPMTVREVINAVAVKYPEMNQKAVTNAVYNARKSGRLLLGEGKRYALAANEELRLNS